jgi:isoleucyl-tRNA synthetase
MNFKKVDPKQSFPKLEEEILKFWKENKIFEKSVGNRDVSDSYEFYDWPPFATWTPHYGHILAWTIKDVIPRFWTMKGKRVERIFWWDCHGLPIENIVEKKLWISWIDDIEKKIWVYNFNEECRNNVFLFTEEWKKTVDRMWRWVDMENAYKTMDTWFMESIWWVFKQLYDKWLIYEWNRVVPYCPRCSTPLSNFEVNQWYANKQDKSVTVKFKILDSLDRYVLAWTTTPWTLIANLWLAVWKNIDYVEIFDKKENEYYILAKDRLWSYYKNESDYDIIKNYKWEDLKWIKYEPVITYFYDKTKWLDLDDMYKRWVFWNSEIKWWSWKIIIWHHVTTESWTWIVHIAPAYWEDDNIIWKETNLWFISHIDDTWKTSWIGDDSGIWVFDYNEQVIQKLKHDKRILAISTIDHSYPFCWRCDTPLIYRAIPAWYVKVEQFRDDMVKNNEKITWVPDNIKHWRFWNWLENARDWNISRNRYWWSAIPVWQYIDESWEKKEICIWSIEELYELNKDFWQIEKKEDWYYYKENWSKLDIHKHFVDKIKIKHPKSWEEMIRVPEVLDCWFESWSMPYAAKHYPFENKEKFETSFPADFIAEWLDQTRWWFYTLIILSTALKNDTCFKNVIVNGIILAEDGKKMSKRLKNYPEPEFIFDKYWADAMRFYLMNSQVVEAQDLRFSKDWVEEVVKKLILPIWNTFYFFTTYANIDNFDISKWDYNKNNNLDRWIISELNKLIKDVEEWFLSYRLQKAARPIIEFMDKLTNWYIRRSRRRFWKSENDWDKLQAYTTLNEVLIKLCQIMAPFTPFITDYIYKELTKKESVHLSDFPVYDINLIDEKLNSEMQKVQIFISLWLNWRTSKKIRVRQPLKSITIWENLSEYYIDILKEELNVKQVNIVANSSLLATKICKPNAKLIWPKFWKDVQFVISQAKSWNFEEIWDWKIKVWEYILNEWEYEIWFEKKDTALDVESWFWLVIALDPEITEYLKLEWYARDIVRFVQESRKEANYDVDNRIKINISFKDENWKLLNDIINKFGDYIQNETLSTIVDDLENIDLEKNVDIEDLNINIKLKR